MPPQGFKWLGDAACEQDPQTRDTCKSAVIAALLAAGASPLIYTPVGQSLVDECAKQYCDTGQVPPINVPQQTPQPPNTSCPPGFVYDPAQGGCKPAPGPSPSPPSPTAPSPKAQPTTPTVSAGASPSSSSTMWWVIGGLALGAIVVGMKGAHGVGASMRANPSRSRRAPRMAWEDWMEQVNLLLEDYPPVKKNLPAVGVGQVREWYEQGMQPWEAAQRVAKGRYRRS